MPKRKDRFAFMSLKPTSVLIEIRYVVNGGDVRGDELRAVRRAVVEGASEAAVTNGMSWSMTTQLRSMAPELFEKMLIRKGLINTDAGGNQLSNAERSAATSASEAP